MKYLAALLLLSGCATYPQAVAPAKPLSCSGDKVIYVISHGWHTGISVRSTDINHLLPALETRFPHKTYYEFGWGDSGFYQSNEITTGLTLRAMFSSAGSVLHVVGFNDAPRLYFPASDVRQFTLAQENYDALLQFIRNSFKTDHTGNIIAEKSGIYGNSQFYTGIGTYHLFNTCNKWTAKALYSAGFDLHPMLKLTSSGVMNALGEQCKTPHGVAPQN